MSEMTPEEAALIKAAQRRDTIEIRDDEMFQQPYKNIKRALFLELVLQLQADDLIEFDWHGTPPMPYVHCGDTFYWATADAQLVEMHDLVRLRQLLIKGDQELDEDGECHYWGRLVWLCEKRQMRPIKPIFEKLGGWAKKEIEKYPERQHAGDECWVPGCGEKHDPPQHEELL